MVGTYLYEKISIILSLIHLKHVGKNKTNYFSVRIIIGLSFFDKKKIKNKIKRVCYIPSYKKTVLSPDITVLIQKI